MMTIILLCIAEALLFAPLSIYHIITITINKIRTKISFKDSLSKYGLPIIELTNNGNKFKFLCDTGATGSVIDSRVLDKIPHKLNDEEDEISGVGKEKITVKTCYAEFQYKNEPPDTIPFCVIDEFDLMNEGICGIVGAPYLVALGIQIDYKNAIIWHK